jgi:hypothetical protein
MPTLNPRVNVTLSPSLDSLVARLAELERVSKSQVLRELLETAEPALSHAVARSNLAKDLHSGIKAVEGTSELMLQNFAHHTRDMVTEAEAIRGRRPAAPVRGVPRAVRSDPAPRKRAPGGGIRAIGAKRPPLSNRGVKS